MKKILPGCSQHPGKRVDTEMEHSCDSVCQPLTPLWFRKWLHNLTLRNSTVLSYFGTLTALTERWWLRRHMLSSAEVYKSTEHFVNPQGRERSKHKVKPRFEFRKKEGTGEKWHPSDTRKWNLSIYQQMQSLVEVLGERKSSAKILLNQEQTTVTSCSTHLHCLAQDLGNNWKTGMCRIEILANVQYANILQLI